MRILKYLISIVIVSISLSSCCHNSKCSIKDIRSELIKTSNKELKIVYAFETKCNSGGSCKPGYGGSDDKIQSISVYLNQKTNNIDKMLSSLEKSINENEGYYYSKNLNELTLEINNILTASFDDNRSSQLDTGYDLNDSKFALKVDPTLVNEIKNNDIIITEVNLNKNRTIIDSIIVTL